MRIVSLLQQKNIIENRRLKCTPHVPVAVMTNVICYMLNRPIGERSRPEHVLVFF